jgi:hypothetical protein
LGGLGSMHNTPTGFDIFVALNSEDFQKSNNIEK